MDLPAEDLMDTVGAFNAAVQPGEYDLDRLDGKRTEGSRRRRATGRFRWTSRRTSPSP